MAVFPIMACSHWQPIDLAPNSVQITTNTHKGFDVQKNRNHSHYSWLAPVIIGIVASSFYGYDFILRVMPMAMAHTLLKSFKIHAGELSILFSGFFYGYAIMQIPAGMLCDRLGARRLLTFGLTVCALATIAFGSTNNFSIAILSRFLMGLTASIAYLGALWVGAYWLGSKRFAMYAGLVQILGCAGAVIGSAPVAHLTNAIGWQKTCYVIAAVGLVIAVINWVVIRDKPRQPELIKSCEEILPAESKFYLREVLKRPQSWWTALFGFSIWGPTALFASSWGALFLMSAHHISNVTATSLMSLIWIGIAIGGPAFGWWTNRIKRRRLPMMSGAIIGIIVATLIIYVPSLPLSLLGICLFFFGTASSSQAISFGLVIDNNRPETIGTASGLTNMGVIFAGVALQPIVGLLLDKFWDGTVRAGAPVYSTHDYQIALAMIPIAFLLALIISSFLIIETNCKKKYR